VATGLLLTVLAVAVGRSRAGEGAESAKGLTNPFFPYCATLPDPKLKELGYATIRNIYTGFDVGKQPPHAANLKDQIRSIKGTDTVFWLTVSGNRASIEETDAKAAEILRDLGAVAEEAGVRISIYPHTGNYIATAREGARLVKKVNHKAVGLTINLCHELMNDQGPELDKILDEIAPCLFVVTINGADKKEKGQRMGWDRLIQPLGKGDFDVYAFLKKVKAIGFKGPIGLQCYGLKGDPLAFLTQSATAWKDYSSRLAAEEAGVK
jgi:sugar phosphate isomerase/epimerase